MAKDINIKSSKRGTFTAMASRRGLGVQEFATRVINNPDNYSEAMRKKAQFAKNATKFNHENGGNILPEFGLGGDIFGGAVSGASAGAALGPWGAAGGAALGIVSGIVSSNKQKKLMKEQQRQLNLQNSVQRGLANYAANNDQQSYSATFEDGGAVKGIGESDNWTRNWYNQRANILQQNMDESYAGLENVPYLNKPNAQDALSYMNNKLDKMGYWGGTKAELVKRDSLPEDYLKASSRGFYNYTNDTIFADNPETLSHEEAHASGLQGYSNKAVTNRLSKYRNQADGYFSRFDDATKANKYRDYMLKPTEVQSNLMEIRKRYNLDPTKSVTKEQLQNMRSEESLSGQGSYLFKMYDDDAMMDFLNNIAYNQNDNNTDMKMARKGAYIMEKGGDVTSKRVQNISDQIETARTSAPRAWADLPTVQDPLYNSSMFTKFVNDPNLDIKVRGDIPQGSEAEKYIRGNWQYPYSQYVDIVDKKTGESNYYPTLTESQLSELAKRAGKKVVYAEGGNIMGLPTQGVELEGGESLVMPDGSNMNVNGPSHEQGGVPMELPETTRVFSDKIKVPGSNKTFSDVNKKLSKDIVKLQNVLDNSRETRLAKLTAEKMLTKLEAEQNTLFSKQQMLNGNSNGEQRKFWPGGEVMASLTGQGMSASIPASNKLATMTNDTSGLNENKFVGKGYGDGMFSKANIGSTIGGIASAAPVAYNLLQGMFSKPEQLDNSQFQNQAANQALSMMNNRRVNVDPMLEANKNAFNIANRNINTASRTRGERMAGYATTAAARGLADAGVYANKQNIENQYRGETAQMSANLGQQAAATNMTIADYNAKNRAAQRNMTSTGLSQLSQLAQQQQITKGQQRADQMRINALEGLLPNYTVDFKTGRLTYKPA